MKAPLLTVIANTAGTCLWHYQARIWLLGVDGYQSASTCVLIYGLHDAMFGRTHVTQLSAVLVVAECLTTAVQRYPEKGRRL
jgi:hypothetical protein